MIGLGVTELVIILVIILVLFGASRLPQIGRGLGEGISNFKRSIRAGSEGDEDTKP
jgi:sec-independent protein translocase protein TatA